MPAQRKLTQDIVVRMYTDQHLTMQQIATLHSVSKAAVNNVLKRAGVDRTAGTYVNRNCGYCGKPVKVRRARARVNEHTYCGTECYYASFANPNFVAWRQGTRIARALVGHWFELESEHIVHHVDSDERNNDLANLEVYASTSDHMAMHRGRKVEPIWRGKDHVRTPLDPTAPTYNAQAVALRSARKDDRAKWAERAAMRQERRRLIEQAQR